MSQLGFVTAATTLLRSGRVLGPMVTPPTPPPTTPSVFALRGDPTFDATTDLSAAQKTRYDKIKANVASTTLFRNVTSLANKGTTAGDIWWFGHDLDSHVMAQLIAFRVTGDLWFLDRIYDWLNIMKPKLRTSWYFTVNAQEGYDDGFLKWLHYENSTADNQGTDLREDYDWKAHAAVARMVWALENNRDLQASSPGSKNYGAMADYFKDYLVTHFEAKWRSRSGGQATGFPIRPNMPGQNDRYADWMRWHYYMGLLTGNSAYTTEAERMGTHLLTEMCQVAVTGGNAYVWNRNNTLETSVYGQYLSPTTYAEFLMGDALDLYLEGFHVWADPVHLQRLALTMTKFVNDTATPITSGMARDVGGGVTRCSKPASSTSFARLTAFRYQNAQFGMLSAWDPNYPELSDITDAMQVHGEAQSESGAGWDTTRVLAALFLDAAING